MTVTHGVDCGGPDGQASTLMRAAIGTGPLSRSVLRRKSG
jgi:hypothetical protein